MNCFVYCRGVVSCLFVLAMVNGVAATVSMHASASRADVKDTSKDEDLLRKAGIRIERDTLLLVVNRGHRVPIDEKALAGLIERLGDDAFNVREKTSQQIVEVGVIANRLLLLALKHKDPEVTRRARACLIEIGRKEAVSKAALRLLVERQASGTLDALLRSPHQSVRWDCLQQVQVFGFNNQAAQAITLLSLADEDRHVAQAAREAVYDALRFDPLPAVLRLANSPRPRLRAAAMFLLGKFDKDPATLPLLLAGSKDKDVRVRRDAAFSLGHFPNDVSVIDVLCALLDDPDLGDPGEISVAGQAARTLAGVTTTVDRVIECLGKASRTGKEPVQAHAIRSLGLICDKEKAYAARVLPHLIRATKSSSPHVCASAASAFRHLGVHAAPAVDSLIAILKESPAWSKENVKYVQTNVFSALREIGPAARSAVPLLTHILETETDQDVLRWATNALGGMGPVAQSAIPVLQRRAKGRDSLISRAAKAALKKINAK